MTTSPVTRIRLRPYHPTYVVGFFGLGGMDEGHNRRGFNYVLEAIRANPDIEVEFVESYDDICARCDRLVEDADGSVWGERHTCSSAQSPGVVESVTKANGQVLETLGLRLGSVIPLRDLVALLRERLPDIGKSGIDQIGGPAFQEKYAKGLDAIAALWE